jgi:hypothetical protein
MPLLIIFLGFFGNGCFLASASDGDCSLVVELPTSGTILKIGAAVLGCRIYGLRKKIFLVDNVPNFDYEQRASCQCNKGNF